MKYKPAKFKVGDLVKLPTGEELQVESIHYMQAMHWYCIAGAFYKESELKKC